MNMGSRSCVRVLCGVLLLGVACGKKDPSSTTGPTKMVNGKAGESPPIQETEEEIDELIQSATQIEFADFVTDPGAYQGKVVRFRVLWESYSGAFGLSLVRVSGLHGNSSFDLEIHPLGASQNDRFLCSLNHEVLDLVVRGKELPKVRTESPEAMVLAVQLAQAKSYRRLYPTREELGAFQKREAEVVDKVRKELNQLLERGELETAWRVLRRSECLLTRGEAQEMERMLIEFRHSPPVAHPERHPVVPPIRE